METAFFWRWWNEQSDQMQNLVRDLVAEGRLEFIGGGWSMNDEAATHYTGIIDNMAIGLQELQEHFGMLPETPAITYQLSGGPLGQSFFNRSNGVLSYCPVKSWVNLRKEEDCSEGREKYAVGKNKKVFRFERTFLKFYPAA